MLWNNVPAPLREPMSINKLRKLLYLTTDYENWIFSCVYAMLRYCIDVFMGTCKMLITLFLLLDGWVVGWVIFHHFHVLFHHFHVLFLLIFSGSRLRANFNIVFFLFYIVIVRGK